jgi:hypothetical protein
VVVGLLVGVGAADGATGHGPRIVSIRLTPLAPTWASKVIATVSTKDLDGARVRLTYRWLRNGHTIADATNRTLVLAKHGIHKGDHVSVRVTARDGARSVTKTSAAVAVRDIAPQASWLVIDQQTPTEGDTLTATLVASDADDDSLSEQRTWSWTCPDATSGTAVTMSLDLAAHDLGHGCTIGLSDTVSDGQLSVVKTAAAVTVADRAPTIGAVQITPFDPTAGVIVTASASTDDPDGDTVTSTCAWTVAGSPADTTDCSLDLGNVSAHAGDAVSVTMTASDGTLSASGDAETTVSDTPPIIGSASIDEASPATNDTVHAVVSASDADGDPVTLSYQWLQNDAPIDGATGSSLDLSVAGHGDHGDRIAVTVTASDGTAQTSTTTSDVTVSNTPPQLAHAVIHYDTSTATATVSTAATDNDHDPLTESVRWTINGEDAGSASTLDLAAAGAHIGDQIGARVWVTDSLAASSDWVTAPIVAIAAGVPAAPPMNRWHLLTIGEESVVAAIMPVTSTPGELYTFEAFALHQSTDGGATWTDHNGPCVSGTVADDDPDHPSTIYVGCVSPNGLFRTDDGGSTWQALPIAAANDGNAPTITTLTVDPTHPDTVFAGTIGGGPDLFRSTDGGQSWQAVDPSSTMVYSVTIDPTDGQHVLVSTDQGVFVTTDGGDTWTGPYGPGAMQVAFDPVDHTHLWAIRRNVSAASVLESTDGGITWTTVAGSPSHLTAIAVAPGVIDVAGTAGVSQSADGGTSWITSSTSWNGHLSTLAADQANPHRVYVGLDTGGTWQADFTPDMAQGLNGYDALRLDGVTNITSTSATLNATLAPLLPPDYGWVGWDSLPGSPNMYAPLVPVTGTNAPQPVVTTLTNLTPDTTYHFRVSLALNAWDQFSGYTSISEASFTTLPATGGSATVNAAPVIHSVSIDHADPVTTTTLHATVDASDPDGDPLSYAYQWLRNGTPIDGATGSSLDLSQPGNGDRGDQISVTVTGDDGIAQTSATSDPITVANTAPELPTATIKYDASTGTASIDAPATDADGDPVTPSVAWTINGQDAGSAETLDLVAAQASIGDTIGASVQASDGVATSDAVTAAPVTITTGPPALVQSPIMPWAIMKSSYSLGADDVISTTNASPDNGATSPPYASAGSCPTPVGANDYRNQISGAETVCPITIGQVIATKAGNNAGPTAQGLTTRITSYQSLDQIAQTTDTGGYVVTAPTSSQLVRIPVVTSTADGGTTWPLSGNVTVNGWVWAVITGYTGSGAQVDVTIVGSTL